MPLELEPSRPARGPKEDSRGNQVIFGRSKEEGPGGTESSEQVFLGQRLCARPGVGTGKVVVKWVAWSKRKPRRGQQGDPEG